MRFISELEREERGNELARNESRALQIERFGVRSIEPPPRFGLLYRYSAGTVTVVDDVRHEEQTFAIGSYDQIHNWQIGQLARAG